MTKYSKIKSWMNFIWNENTVECWCMDRWEIASMNTKQINNFHNERKRTGIQTFRWNSYVSFSIGGEMKYNFADFWNGKTSATNSLSASAQSLRGWCSMCNLYHAKCWPDAEPAPFRIWWWIYYANKRDVFLIKLLIKAGNSLLSETHTRTVNEIYCQRHWNIYHFYYK